MTFVVGLLSPNHIIQVSDRRLVTLEGDGSVRQREGEFNKAVLYCNLMAFAYCGLAEMGPRRQRTDLWMADGFNAAGEVDQGQLLADLGRRATERLRHPLFKRLAPSQRRHGFMAVGWAALDGSGRLEPYVSVLSNFSASSQGGAGRSEAESAFQIDLQDRLGNRGIYATWMGAVLTDGERGLFDEIDRLDPLANDFAERAVRILITQIRSVADRLETVGRGLLVNVIPREATRPRAGNLLLAGSPEEGEQTFLYVPPDQDTGVVYGPTYACGGVQMSNFEARGVG